MKSDHTAHDDELRRHAPADPDYPRPLTAPVAEEREHQKSLADEITAAFRGAPFGFNA